MKTALYIRVSSEAQAEKGYSIEDQLDKLKGYCKINDIYEYNEYIDAGYTGSNLDRPDLQRLIRDIENKAVNSVIVCKLDRLSRRTKDTLYLVENIFNKYSVKFVSLAESIDTASPSGYFFLSILSSVAQLERDTIKERTIAGRRKKAESGMKSKSANILRGYDFNDSTQQFTINETEAAQVRLIFQMFLDGESITAIARYMLNHFPSRHIIKNDVGGNLKQVWRILENETYTGKLYFDGKAIPAKNIPAIINEDTFRKAQELIKTRKKKRTRTNSKHLLSGLLFCGKCGARLRTYFTHQNKHNYYICYSRGNNNPHMVKDRYCTLPYFNYDELNTAILNSVKKIIGNKTYFDKVKTKIIDYGEQIALIEKELKKLSDRANKIIDLLIDGTIDKEALTARMEDINRQKEHLQTQLKATEQAQSEESTVNYNQAKEYAKDLVKSPPERQRDIIKRLIKKIILYEDKRIDILWNF